MAIAERFQINDETKYLSVFLLKSEPIILLTRLVKAVLSRTPYRIVRRAAINRFQAVDETLASFSKRGWVPGMVIDGGANVGEFSRKAIQFFPSAEIHAIEPQPGCLPELRRLEIERVGKFIVHNIALCAPQDSGKTLKLATDAEARSTGAHVMAGSMDVSNFLEVPCLTLDQALSSHRKAELRALLKLDLQGYELHALRGSTKTLELTDVILTEVSFYAQSYEPSIAALIAQLAALGFELYDIAAIYSRPRDDRPRQGDFVFVRRESLLASDTRWD